MKAFISYGLTGGLVIMLALFAFSSSGSAHEGGFAEIEGPVFTKHFQHTLFDITEHSFYSVEILLDNKEYKIGKDVIGVIIHNAKDEDVKGAKLFFAVKDLVTGKNVTVSPVITDKGNGLYIVSGLELVKKGKWKLSVTVKKGSSEDSVKFVLPDALKSPLPKGRYSP
jgi:hypothetical protein